MSAKHLKVAIIGTGFGLRTQLPGFRLAGGWEVVSLTGRDPDRTRRLADESDIPHALTSIEEALRTGEPDVVSVSTPPRCHLAEATATLEGGRSCLLEKPMAMSAEESAALTALAARAPFAAIDHELRALPNPRRLKERIAAGDIGRPLFARVVFTSHGRARPGTTWNWWSQQSEGGGILGAIGSHVVDMLMFWLGDVTRVGARLTTTIDRLPDESGTMRKVDADDGSDLWLTFANGATGTVSLTTVADRYRGIHWEIHGSEGSLWIDSTGALYGARRGGEPEDLSVDDGLGDGPIIDGTFWARGFVLLARDVRDYLRDGKSIDHLATFADGWRTQRVLDAAREAAAGATFVSTPPVS